MKRLALLPLLLLPISCASTQTSAQTPTKPPADPLHSLDFLIGTWSAKADAAAGSSGAGALGAYTFRRDLDGHAIVRSSSLDKCTAPSDFHCAHHDMLTIFSDPAFVAASVDLVFALYLDNEGHAIYYAVTTPDPHTALFLSQSPPATPHFRLTYHLEGEGPTAVMTGRFEMAPPNSDKYVTYLAWSGTRQ